MFELKEEYRKTIGKVLRDTRKANKKSRINQDQIAAYLGMSKGNISKIERGAYEIATSDAAAFMYACGSEMAAFDGPLEYARKKHAADAAAAEEEPYIPMTMEDRYPPAFMMMAETSKDTMAGLSDYKMNKLKLAQIHTEGVLRVLEDAGLPADFVLNMSELLSVQYKLLELNYDIISNTDPKNTISSQAVKRLDLYRKLMARLNNESKNAMIDLIPPGDEPVYDDGRVPVTIDGFTFYVDREEAKRFKKVRFTDHIAPEGKVRVRTNSGVIFVDPDQAEKYHNR